MINAEPRARASIAWVTSKGLSFEPAFCDAVGAAGYRLHSPDEPGVPDVAVADIRIEFDLKSGGADAIARARALGARAGIVVAASAGADRMMRAALRRYGDVAYVGADAAPILSAVRERLRLSSLADETAERIKSLIADGRAVSFADLRDRGEKISVLVAGKPSPLTLNSCNAVRKVAEKTSCVFSAGQVMRALDHERFDCAIFHPADETDLLIALARALRRHREHRRIPLFIASDNEELLTRSAARDGFETILGRHVDQDLGPRVETVVRRARMASTMRDFLRSAEGCGGGKAGAAGARFFALHSARLIALADETRKPLSLVALALEPRIAAGADEVASALTDAARTASRLVRAEDLIVRLSATTLVVMLRSTGADDAARVARRLEGVIAGTLLRSTLEIARISTAWVEREQGDSLESSLAALIRDLRSPMVAVG